MRVWGSGGGLGFLEGGQCGMYAFFVGNSPIVFFTVRSKTFTAKIDINDSLKNLID
jgi:hypothetical protein